MEWKSRRHRQRIATLEIAIAALAAAGTGDYSPVEIDGNDDIANLARLVNETADALELQRRDRQQVEQRFHLALELGQGMIWDWDMKDNTMTMTDSGRLVGFQPEAFPGTFEGAFQHVHPEDRSALEQEIMASIANDGMLRAQFRICIPDGPVRWVLAQGQAIWGEDGTMTRMVGGALDVSDRRSLEAELEKVRRLESIGGLAGGIAHDFNNLLTVIQATAELMGSEVPEDSKMQSDVNAIIDAAQRGTSLTRKLLTFSRKDRDQPVLMDVGEVLGGLEDLIRRTAGRDVVVEIVLADELPLVKLDPGAIEQAMLNLVGNARDAMPDGGRLRVEARAMDLPQVVARKFPAALRGRNVRITVSDTGIGMSAEVLDSAVEPFFTTKSVDAGTGLGLPTVHGMIRTAQGALQINSVIDQGTDIVLWLPAAKEVELQGVVGRGGAPVGSAATSVSAPASSAPGAQQLILVVEDEEEVRRLVCRLLVSDGYGIVTAVNGAEALEVLDGLRRELTLVITDVVMPELSGAQLAAALKRRENPPPVLFMSGYTDRLTDQEDHLASDDWVLPKPFTRDSLFAAVTQAIQTERVHQLAG